MSVAETSLEAFTKKKPEINGDQQKVFNALKEIGPATAEEVAKHIGVPPHTISGRFGGENELEDQGLIEKNGKKQNTRGYMATIWKVKN
jgi:predicted ArsR family transcriptional regulator